MALINYDPSHIINQYISEEELTNIQSQVSLADKELREGTGAGNEFLGWLDLPVNYDKEELKRVKEAAKKIQSHSDILVVIGIGGSYLGAKAALNILNHSFYNQMARENAEATEIYFAGTNFSSKYYTDLLEVIGDRDFSLNVISKSGTTTEPSIGLRIFKERLYEKYGDAASERIYATTDASKGALKTEANEKGYETFVIPDNIGGRFTVLTAVGLLPIAVSGQDVDALLAGARDAREQYSSPLISENDAYAYATIRNLLYRKGYNVEVLVNYEPSLTYLSEWWKQLFGESEGKDQSGIFPASVNFTTDLHSMGQYIQDGRRNLFETVLYVDGTEEDIAVPKAESSDDGLSYLEGKTLAEINRSAFEGALLAHEDGGVPVMGLHVEKLDAYALGYIFYFFELAVAISGYLNGVNPFNQPGVESYKQNMFALLGRPGYEERAEDLKKRM